MNIIIGKPYKNKTWRYLLPCLKYHGTEFTKFFDTTFKLAVGIHDTLVNDSPYIKGRNIFILIDKRFNEPRFDEFLQWIKLQDYYVEDYCPDSEILLSVKHIVIVNVPKGLENAYDMFVQSKYSKMYNKSQLEFLFSNVTRKNEYDVFTRTTEKVKEFVKEINTQFKTDVTLSDVVDAELETPLVKEEEIFNYFKEETMYFNREKDLTWQL